MTLDPCYLSFSWNGLTPLDSDEDEYEDEEEENQATGQDDQDDDEEEEDDAVTGDEDTDILGRVSILILFVTPNWHPTALTDNQLATHPIWRRLPACKMHF